VSELVIVASDLYFTAGSRSQAAADAHLPALERMARFGTARALRQGWRSWLAAWLGRPQLAAASPAPVAALATPCLGGPQIAGGTFIWLAEPLHLAASLTSVHLSPRGVLRIEAAAQAELCAAFNATFAAVGYRLVPARAGRFLATGPAPPGPIETTDPARLLGSTLAEALPRGGAAGALRRLGAEIEMWLHEHPLNARREAARCAPISTLWLWGGGAPLAGPSAASRSDSPDAANGPPAIAVFSDDAYVDGLSHLLGVSCASAAARLAALGAPREPRILTTLELFTAGEPPCESSSLATPLRSLESLDREWLEPALERVAHGALARCTLVANDRCVSLAARDRWRLWRRPRTALAALVTSKPPAAP
jgi:hypothetical protein